MTSMRTRVKICGITREDDALAAVEAGADAIGFVFWAGSPRAVSIARAREIARTVPPFVTLVGLFVDPDPDEVRATFAVVPLDALQFHGSETAASCRAFGRRYVKAIGVGPGVDLLEWAHRYDDASALLLDAPPAEGMRGGTGRTFDWSAVPRTLSRPVVLSGGLDVRNVGAAIRAVRPWAVDVSSGVEATGADGRPVKGIKDSAKIAAFIEEVRNADG